MSPLTQVNASPITKITSWLKFLGKNLHLVGCANLCAKSEVMLINAWPQTKILHGLLTSILELWCMIISATSREQDARVSNPHHTIHPNILGICNCFENPFPPYILIIWYMHGRLTFASHEYTMWVRVSLWEEIY